MIIQIFNRKGEVAYTVPVGDSSTYNWKLQSEEYISVAFSAGSVLQVKKGFYTDIEGLGRFEIVNLPEPTASTKGEGYEYELRMDKPWAKFKNRIIYLQRGSVLGMESKWSLTDTIESHCSVLTDNLKKCGFNYEGSFYHVVIHDGVDTEKSKLIDYDATSLLDALTKIAEAFECEWWIVEDAIHMGRCETGDSEVTLTMHDEIASLSRSEDSNQHGTRLYAFGSSRNLNQNYRRRLKNPFTVNGWKDIYDSKVSIKTKKPKAWYSVNGVLEIKTGHYKGTRYPFTVKEGTYTENGWNDPTFELDLPLLADTPGIAPGDKVQFVVGDATVSQTDDSIAEVTSVGRNSYPCFSFKDLKLPEKAINGRTTITLADGTVEKHITFIGVVLAEDGKESLNEGRDFFRFTDGSKPKSTNEQTATLAHASMMYVGKLYTEPVDGQAEVAVLSNSSSDNVLQLPIGTPYIDSPGLDDGDEIIEVREQNEDIYPRALLTIDAVTTIDAKETDQDTGNVTYWKAYRFTAKKQDGTPFYFDSSYLINEANKPLSIHFESGKLSGMEFEVHFNPEYKAGENRLFEITRNKNYQLDLPNEIACPQIGDTLYMFNMDADIIDDELVTAAEQELKTWAEKEMKKICRDSGTYTATINPVEWGRKKIGRLQYGQKVKLDAPHLVHTEDGTRSSRIIAWELKLYDTTQGEYTIGESSAYSKGESLSNEVQELVYYNGQIKKEQTGSGVYLVKKNDFTPFSDTNAMSSLRAKDEFLDANNDDEAKGRITFHKGLESKDTIVSEGSIYTSKNLSASGDGTIGGNLSISGDTSTANIDVEGRTTTHNLVVTGKANFFELEIQKATAAGGLQIYSAGAGKADMVEETHIDPSTLVESDVTEEAPANAYKLYQLSTGEDGENALLMVQPGDLLCSFTFNSASAAGTYSNAANRYWWRKCIKVNSTPVTRSGKSYYVVYVSMEDCDEGSSAPQAGDRFMVLGSKIETAVDRKNAIVICAHEGLDSSLTAPYIAQYVGINDYNLSAFRRSWWGYRADGEADVHFVGDFSVQRDNSVTLIPADKGAWVSGEKYYYYDRVSYGGSLWLMTKRTDEGITEPPSATSAYWTEQVSKGEQGEKGDEPLMIRISGNTVIRNSTGSVTLTAKAFRGAEDVTAMYPDPYWYWERESGMPEYDKAWNARHEGIGPTCTITADEINSQASIACEIRK